MIDSFLLVKLIHIVSAAVIFGTGMGTAFFMLKAHLGGRTTTIRDVSRHVVTADWMFTSPAVFIQLATGLWLADRLGIGWSSWWLKTVLVLFAATGLCWIPVVVIQIRIARIAARELDAANDREYRLLMRHWTALGIPAFAMTLVLFALMVFKPVIL